jgi:RNA ligase
MENMHHIRSLSDIQALIQRGERDWSQYGEVNAVYDGDLVLFNYTQAAQFKPVAAWNWFETNARGLIFNSVTGECIARPFSKFWNYGQLFPMPGVRLIEVTEKMDGSLGILYHHNGQWRIATRGSFTGEQARWATDWFQSNYRFFAFDKNVTLLFEIIYPENRIVVDYGKFNGLVLIGARNIQYGHEMYAPELDHIAANMEIARPKSYTFESIDDILNAATALSANQEGWVLRYSDNTRLKVKGDAYKIAHKILTGCNFNHVLESVEQGKYEQLIDGVPDEFLDQIFAWKTEIDETHARITSECLDAFARAPSGTQKDFALWVQANYTKDYQSYLFALKAGKPIDTLIYRNAFRDRG